MKSNENSSLKRKTTDTPTVAKLRFDQVVQSLEVTPPKKAVRGSDMKKLTSQDPKELFQNCLKHEKRGSTGFEIKSKAARKRSKNSKKKEEKKPENLQGGFKICKELYAKCTEKVRGRKSEFNIEDYLRGFTPIIEKKSESKNSTETKNKTEIKCLSLSPITPSERVIRVPNSYRRQRRKKCQKKIN